MKELWTRHAIPVCMPPAISERTMLRIANRKQAESVTAHGNRTGRIKDDHCQRNEAVHWDRC